MQNTSTITSVSRLWQNLKASFGRWKGSLLAELNAPARDGLFLEDLLTEASASAVECEAARWNDRQNRPRTLWKSALLTATPALQQLAQKPALCHLRARYADRN